MFKDFELKYNQISKKDHLEKSTKHSNKFDSVSTNSGILMVDITMFQNACFLFS